MLYEDSSYAVWMPFLFFPTHCVLFYAILVQEFESEQNYKLTTTINANYIIRYPSVKLTQVLLIILSGLFLDSQLHYAKFKQYLWRHKKLMYNVIDRIQI